MSILAPARTSNPSSLGSDEAHQPIDAAVRLVTPERVVFTYPLAGPCRRVLAYGVDALVIACVIIGTSLLMWGLFFGGGASLGVTRAVMFAVIWGYGAGCEAIFNGRTLGKKVVGLRVIGVQGVPITGSQAMVRNLVGAVEGPLPFLYLPALVSMALTRRFQRLGDLAAGTMVVVEVDRPEAKLLKVEERAVADLLPYLPLRMAARPETARALADFVKQRGRFLPARREEIAHHLAEPLRERHGLPATASGDAILCAYYHRLFHGD